jgi:hypothetical protein
MSAYYFKIKKRKKYSNLEKKNFFFNKIYNTKIIKSSIIYKNWLHNIANYYIKNGNKKTIFRKIKKELMKIYNEITNQKKIIWVIVLNESHQRSDFITSSFKKKFSKYTNKNYFKKQNLVKQTNKKEKNNSNSIYEYKKQIFNNKKLNWYKTFYFYKIISFFISKQTFFWFLNIFKIFKKKNFFIKKNQIFFKKFVYEKAVQKIKINQKNNFEKNKIRNIKHFKKTIFIKLFSKHIIFNFIQKKKYFFIFKKKKSKKKKYTKNYFYWNKFFWNYYSKNKKKTIKRKNWNKKKIKNKKKIYKKWMIIKKKNKIFNFIFEKNIKFYRWKNFFKKNINLKKNKIKYKIIFDKKKKKYWFSISEKKNFVFYKIKEINLQNEGKYLIIERNYSKINFNNMYYDIVDLISPFFKIIEQQKKTRKTSYIKYIKKKNSNFYERQKTFFWWIKKFIIKNDKYNNLIRNPSKPKKKNISIKNKKSNRVTFPFSSRFFTEFNKIFYFEGELFNKLNEMDQKNYSKKTKKHFRWKILLLNEIFCSN